MSDEVGATTVLLVGALLLRLTLEGTYARYVKAGMYPWLLVAGFALAVLGLFGVIRALAARKPLAHDPALAHDAGLAHDHHHQHSESPRGTSAAYAALRSERAGWLLLAPVIALLLVTPPALGSFGVDRSTVVDVTSDGQTFAALPAGRTVPMTLLEFDQRAADHDGASFGTTQVELTGFVARTPDGDGFRLARYQIQCCAADAVAAVVRVVGASGDPPARDQWVTVTGTFHGSPGEIPELLATSLSIVGTPGDPYE